MKRVLLLGLLFASIALFSQSKGDGYWSGGSLSSDNISDGSNWWSGSNPHPNSGDNLYFNNTSNRHWVYCNYAGGSWFDKIITYTGAGGIKIYGDNIYAYVFENNNDGNLFELSPSSAAEGSREIGNRDNGDLSINPRGSGGVLVSCDKINMNNTSGAKTLYVNGDNTLTIDAEIYETNGTGANFVIQDAATVILKSTSTYSGTTTLNGGILELQGSIASSDITVKDGAKLIINGSNIIVKSISVEASGSVEVLAGQSLTVTGTLNNLGMVTLKSDQTGKAGNPTGSLIVNGTITGNISVERFIAGHGDAADAGWHLLSTPMTSTTVLGSVFYPLDNDDFYRYDEASDVWINRKNSDFDMSAGIGYLCSYETDATKVFTGPLNNGDLNVSSLTISGDGSITEAGWNLVGNPYASALIWTNTWGINIDPIAKVYLGGSGNYQDINPGNLIPSMQGFFVKVTAPTSMTILKSARFHSSNTWTKEVQSDIESLNLKVSGGTNSFYDISRVRFAESATENFDSEFDSHKMYGQATAPQLFTRIEEEVFSTNTFADSQESRTINLDFIPGTDGEYTIEFVENTIPQKGTISLEDLVTNQVIDVYSNESYTFTAEVGDEQARFKLHFGATGINELAKDNLQAYISGQNLYIIGESGPAQLEVFDIQGKQLVSEQIVLDENYKKALSLPSGIYVVRVQSNEFIKSNKVIIK